MINRRRFMITSATGLAFMRAGNFAPAVAQVAGKTARLLVGTPPGGALDTVARLLVNEMKDYSPLIVDNRPGAGERIALEALKTGATDGSLLMLTGSSPIALFPHSYRKLSYDPLKDFIAVSTVATFPFLLTVGPMVPASVKTLPDFVGWCRANPAKASYGAFGAGSPHHFIGAMLARGAGFQFTHVPYQGAVAAVQDLLGGQIAATVFPAGVTLPHMQSGALRGLATTGAQRSSLLPDVPTFKELGFSGIEIVDWFGIFVPAQTPSAIVSRLNGSIRDALKKSEVSAGLAKLSFEPASSSSSEFALLVKSDFERWGRIVKESGFTAID